MHARHLVRFTLIAAVAALGGGLLAPTPASAHLTPNGVEWHPITFPVVEQGAVYYSDDFGGARNHPGNDIMGKRLLHLVAAASGTIEWVRADGGGNSGNMISLEGKDGWHYWYIHINNDTPGTDDGKNPAKWKFAPGIKRGSKVTKGQFIAYMGDSGQAESTDPHLHFEIHRPDGSFINPYTSLRVAQGTGANGQCALPSNPAGKPNAEAGRGFWTVTATGSVKAYGKVKFYGRALKPAAPNRIVAIEPTSTGKGYWLVDVKGKVQAFGDAKSYGGASKLPLKAPIIGMTAAPGNKGYWLLALDGGIFSYGSARFYGSTGAMKLNAPIISMSASAGGKGYWLLASDGGIFSYGDARFYGSTGSMKLKFPVVAMSESATGKGYRLLGKSGAVYSFGDAKTVGSIPGFGWCAGPSAMSIARTTTGNGYWILMSDHKVYAFGDAKPWGQPAATGNPAVMLATAN